MPLRFVPGNRLTLLRNGEEYFPALVTAIDAAKREIFLETYIFADDQTGSLIAEALARAAARGLAVHVVVDGFGARDFAPRFRAMLQDAGAQVLVFRPKISPLTLRRSRLRRMHRKLVVVDAECAFVGGINIVDDFDSSAPSSARYDFALRIEGPLVNDVRLTAASLWSSLAWLNLRIRSRLPGASPKVCPPRGTQTAALVVRDNFRHRRDIETAYLELIDAARGEVLIAMAYFFPGRQFRRALVGAAERGVHVVLLVQGLSDHLVMHYASRALFGSFLDAGIEIHEHAYSELHAKVAVFDGANACVGSSNIDPFSLLLAREANVFVSDGGLASLLRANLLEAIGRARPIPSQAWKQRSLSVRLRMWVAYGLARLLMSLSRVQGWH